MKRFRFLSFLSLIALALSGCSTYTRFNAPSYASISRNIALSITVNGSMQPTAAQFAMIKAAVAPQLAAAGWTIVDDLRLANRVVRINFIPDPNDPEASGRAVVMGFRANPHAIYAGNARSNIDYSYSNGFYASAYRDPYYGFDRYYDSYTTVSYSGGSNSGGSNNSGGGSRPGRPHFPRPEDCPPAGGGGGGDGGDRPSRWANRDSHRDSGSSWSPSSSSGSSSSNSSSYASMPASPSSSYSSLPTASFGSSSSDSSSSSSSYSSSSSSSSSSGGGSYSGTEVSSNTHQH